MANNRMYLVNTRTGAKIYLAKYYPSTGWRFSDGRYLNDEIYKADFGHLTPEQLKKHEADNLVPRH